MDEREATGADLFVRSGGTGDGPTLLLIHGVSADGEVWNGVRPYLEKWPGRWVIPDLRGHGRSAHREPYGFATFAADLAGLFKQGERLVVLGHSLGGAIAWTLATNLFGVRVERVFSFAVKIRWSEEETQKAHGLASLAMRWFDSRDEAVERYLKVSGLFGLVPASSPAAAGGIVEEGGRFRLRTDPRAHRAAGTPVEPLLRAVQAPISAAVGSRDPMMSVADLHTIDPNGQVFEGCGHNVHVERPELIWDWLQSQR